jgi:hypothetical protein
MGFSAALVQQGYFGGWNDGRTLIFDYATDGGRQLCGAETYQSTCHEQDCGEPAIRNHSALKKCGRYGHEGGAETTSIRSQPHAGKKLERRSSPGAER